MEINLSERVRGILLAFLLLIMPLITILLGMVYTVENVWYFVLAISWFGSGVIFYFALN